MKKEIALIILLVMSVAEHLLQPEYWDNHSFDDPCRGTTVSYLPLSQEEKSLRKQREVDRNRMVTFSLEVLKRNYSPTLNPKIVFEQDLFDGTQYPIGSVVRIYRERLWRDKKFEFKKMLHSLLEGRIEPLDWDEPRYSDLTYLGVLADSTYFPDFQRRRVVRFMEGSWRDGFHSRGWDERAKINIGNVIHKRTVDSWFGTNDDESIERVTKIELLV